MEAETLSAKHLPGFLRRSLPAVVPMLVISIGYVDPGKWVATVEGGARFGFDLMAFMLVFNFAAIFCQYIAARIGVITGRDLAQDIEKTKILGLFVAGFVLLSIVLAILINQPEIPLHINGIPTKLSGESSFVLMSLLGATLVPHNFYLHSSIVQALHGQMPCCWRFIIFDQSFAQGDEDF